MAIRNWHVLAALISGTVHAYDFGDGSIDISEGIEGPITQSIGQGASLTALTSPHVSVGGTLLQITIWNSGQEFTEMSVDEYTKLAADAVESIELDR